MIIKPHKKSENNLHGNHKVEKNSKSQYKYQKISDTNYLLLWPLILL
jgi:hypothetical protein